MARVRFKPPFAAHVGWYHGITYRGHSSYAVDFNRGAGSTDYGDPVLCSLDGTVQHLEPAGGGIVISHPNGYATWYWHTITALVRVGQDVRQGEQIACIGRTYPGTTVISPHLHYEQRRWGRRIRVTFETVPYPASLAAPAGIVVGPLILGQGPVTAGATAASPSQ